MDDDLDFEYVMLTRRARRAARLLKAEAWDEGWMSGLRDAHDCRLDAQPEQNPYRDQTEETA